jgi:single-stranded DNA-binding protein
MNTYVIHDARLVAEPKTKDVKGKTLTTIRVADNPSGPKKSDEDKKRSPARFLTIKAWEKQGDLLAKLSKGDVITASGELTIEAFPSKEDKTVYVTDDVLKLQSFRVQKSESFYGRAADAPDEGTDKPVDDIPF